jgi:lysozyme family protein
MRNEKQMSQLDHEGYFVGVTMAEESPLEPGIFLIPGGAIDTDTPVVPEGKRAKWAGIWVFEDIPIFPPELPSGLVTEDGLEQEVTSE